jgi:hypothetical protein
MRRFDTITSSMLQETRGWDKTQLNRKTEVQHLLDFRFIFLEN